MNSGVGLFVSINVAPMGCDRFAIDQSAGRQDLGARAPREEQRRRLAMLPEPIEHWLILGRANSAHGGNDDDVWAMLELSIYLRERALRHHIHAASQRPQSTRFGDGIDVVGTRLAEHGIGHQKI